MATPFVGRATELALADGALRPASERGGPRVVLILGPPGQGKTRLLNEIRVRERAAAMLAVNGYELERDVPFAATNTFLRSVAGRAGGHALASLLGDRGPDAAAPTDALRVFEAVHRAIGRTPIRLYADDLQWVDSTSLALLHFLVRSSVAGHPIQALVVASRPGGHASDFVVAMQRASAETTVLELGPLSRDEGVELARTIAPALDQASAEAAWARAAGSPFWLGVIVTSSIEGGGDRQSLDVTITGLDPTAEHLLAALAIAGRPASLAELERILQSEADPLTSAVQRLERRGLVVRIGDLIRLAHDIIRQAVLDRHGSEERRALNRAWADLIETGTRNDVQALSEALAHRIEAGVTPVDLAVRIATAPTRRWIGADGIAQLERVADASDGAGAFSAELESAIAALAAELNLHETALRRYARVAERAGDMRAAGRAEVSAARAAYRLGRVAIARAMLAPASSRVVDDAETQVGIAALDALVAIFLEHRSAEGGEAASRAVGMADAELARGTAGDRLDPGLRTAMVDAYQAGAIAALQRDDQSGMVGLLERVKAITVGVDEGAHLSAIVMTGIAHRMQGRMDLAAELSRRVWDDGQRRLLPLAAIEGGAWLAVNLIDLGRIEEARSVATDVSALAYRASGLSFYNQGRSRLVPHELTALRGSWRDAVAMLREGVRDEPDAHSRIGYHEWLMEWLARIDPSAEGEVVAEVEAGRREATASGCPRCATELELHVAEALVRVGRLRDAGDALARYDGLRPRPNGREAPIREWVSALLLAAEKPQAGLAALAETKERMVAAGRGLEAAWVALDQARTLRRTASRAAPAALRAAATAADAVGATTLVGIAEQALRGLGVRTWRRGRGGADTEVRLTARELEVARLVAAGATNAEIADRLYLARKTVERHVSNVLSKTGSRNRVELAARYHEPSDVVHA